MDSKTFAQRIKETAEGIEDYCHSLPSTADPLHILCTQAPTFEHLWKAIEDGRVNIRELVELTYYFTHMRSRADSAFIHHTAIPEKFSEELLEYLGDRDRAWLGYVLLLLGYRSEKDEFGSKRLHPIDTRNIEC